MKKLEQARQEAGLRVYFGLGGWHPAHQRQDPAFYALRDWVRRALAPAGISLLPLDADAAAESTDHELNLLNRSTYACSIWAR